MISLAIPVPLCRRWRWIQSAARQRMQLQAVEVPSRHAANAQGSSCCNGVATICSHRAISTPLAAPAPPLHIQQLPPEHHDSSKKEARDGGAAREAPAGGLGPAAPASGGCANAHARCQLPCPRPEHHGPHLPGAARLQGPRRAHHPALCARGQVRSARCAVAALPALPPRCVQSVGAASQSPQPAALASAAWRPDRTRQHLLRPAPHSTQGAARRQRTGIAPPMPHTQPRNRMRPSSDPPRQRPQPHPHLRPPAPPHPPLCAPPAAVGAATKSPRCREPDGVPAPPAPVHRTCSSLPLASGVSPSGPDSAPASCSIFAASLLYCSGSSFSDLMYAVKMAARSASGRLSMICSYTETKPSAYICGATHVDHHSDSESARAITPHVHPRGPMK